MVKSSEDNLNSRFLFLNGLNAFLLKIEVVFGVI